MEIRVVNNNKTEARHSGACKKKYPDFIDIGEAVSLRSQKENKKVVLGPDNKYMKLGQRFVETGDSEVVSLPVKAAVRIGQDVIAVTSANSQRQSLRKALLAHKYATDRMTKGSLGIRDKASLGIRDNALLAIKNKVSS